MTGTTIGVTTGCILALMLAACDGDSGSGPSPALDVSPNAVTLAPGDPAVRFTATLTDAEGPVSWTLNGVGTLSASSGTTTDYTPPASIAAGSEARVTATAGALTKQATITLDPPPTLTVNGAVVDGCGQPSPAARVWIRGKGMVPVDAAGHFTASDVAAPYDLAVITGPDTVMIAVYASIGRSDLGSSRCLASGPAPCRAR